MYIYVVRWFKKNVNFYLIFDSGVVARKSGLLDLATSTVEKKPQKASKKKPYKPVHRRSSDTSLISVPESSCLDWDVNEVEQKAAAAFQRKAHSDVRESILSETDEEHEVSILSSCKENLRLEVASTSNEQRRMSLYDNLLYREVTSMGDEPKQRSSFYEDVHREVISTSDGRVQKSLYEDTRRQVTSTSDGHRRKSFYANMYREDTSLDDEQMQKASFEEISGEVVSSTSYEQKSLYDEICREVTLKHRKTSSRHDLLREFSSSINDGFTVLNPYDGEDASISVDTHRDVALMDSEHTQKDSLNVASHSQKSYHSEVVQASSTADKSNRKMFCFEDIDAPSTSNTNRDEKHEEISDKDRNKQPSASDNNMQKHKEIMSEKHIDKSPSTSDNHLQEHKEITSKKRKDKSPSSSDNQIQKHTEVTRDKHRDKSPIKSDSYTKRHKETSSGKHRDRSAHEDKASPESDKVRQKSPEGDKHKHEFSYLDKYRQSSAHTVASQNGGSSHDSIIKDGSDKSPSSSKIGMFFHPKLQGKC